MAAAVTVLALPGCEAIKALSFEPAPNSGVAANQETYVAYLTNSEDNVPLDGTPFDHVLSPELTETIRQHCAERAEELAPFVIPLVAAGAQLAFQLGTDALATAVKAVRDRAQRTYRAQVNVHAPVLKADGSKECILIARATVDAGTKEPTALGLIALVEKVQRGDGLALVPTYLALNNAVAETGAGEAPRINLSMAIVVTGLVEGPRVLASGEIGPVVNTVADAVFSFSGVELGNVAADCKDPSTCAGESQIVAPLNSRYKGATIAVAVTETGSGFGETDTALAEIKALQAALGPAIGKSVEIALTPTTP